VKLLQCEANSRHEFLTVPLMAAIQEISTHMGKVAGAAIAASLRKNYPRPNANSRPGACERLSPGVLLQNVLIEDLLKYAHAFSQRQLSSALSS
jgi:hypothetical protein